MGEKVKRVVIVHGWSGGPGKDWLPWLKTELENKGYKVLAPAMPDADEPVIEKWVVYLSEIVGKPDKNTCFVGHSIGCQTILRYLTAHPFKPREMVGGAVFVAGWFDLKNLEDDETRALAKPWTETPIDLAKVKAVLPKSTLIISDNDPYDSFEENKLGFEKIGAKIIVRRGAGHFTAEDGFAKLPLILAELEKLME